MTVVLTVAKTSTGALVNDALSGGGVGYDLGVTRNGSYSGVIDRPTNTGSNPFYFSHDAVNDPITNFSLFVEAYGGNGSPYGGVRSAAIDFTKLQTLAEATDGSPNNNTGNTGGFAFDMDWDGLTVNQFDYINRGPVSDSIVTGAGGGTVRFFRRTNSGALADHGSDLATRIAVLIDGLFYEPGGGPVAASAPSNGQIGISTDSVLGNRGLAKCRLFIPQAELEGGQTQWDLTAAFSFTS